MLFEDISRIIPPDNAMHKFLDDAEVIYAQNVYEYFANEKRDWGADSFPNVAPPFDNMFIEWKHSGDKKYSFGAWVVSFDADEHDFSTFPEPFNQMKPIDPKWVCNYIFFSMADDKIAKIDQNEDAYHYAHWIMAVDSQGNICNQRETQGKCAMFRYPEGASDMLWWAINIPLLTISFMHCKNVTLVEKAPPKGAGKRNRYGPRIRYHVLEIEPMKKILKSEGQSEKTGLKLALHICRGHFKDFSKGKGLFGRHKGMFWWDSQVRGNVSQGVVDKDYSINLGEDDV